MAWDSSRGPGWGSSRPLAGPNSATLGCVTLQSPSTFSAICEMWLNYKTLGALFFGSVGPRRAAVERQAHPKTYQILVSTPVTLKF